MGFPDYTRAIGLDDDTVIVGAGVHFERIRRITGYLVGTLDRFNDGKRAEERDRVKHCYMGSIKDQDKS